MASSISVAVRVRPLTEKEKNLLIPNQSSSSGIFSDGCLTSSSAHQTNSSIASHKSLRSIVKVLDDRVLIFDPAESNPIQQAQRQILARFSSSAKSSPSTSFTNNNKKVKDMRFCFDRVFDETATQEDVYEGSAKDLIDGVLNGFNATVFAYGATGCGKTHTITGTPDSPGIVYLLMKDLFGRTADQVEDVTTEISLSYLEIYNETIRDLLNPTAPTLNLREANSSVSVPGLSTVTPTCASDVITLISSGNSHRTVHGTEANAVSSRSHAVMSVNIRRKPKTAGLVDDWTVATLSVIDLAGSERASVTKNKGDRLLEGANINKSLLALGNCINALCDPKGKGGHVPYRNSKLTRLLKHSLGGNCRTLMIVCVAPTSAHYDETHNTLKYANRAKEIKTKVTRNIISVDRHVSQYVQVIFQLRQELEERKKSEAVKEERLRKELNQRRADLDSAILKARKHWEDYLLKAQPSSYASGRLEGLEAVRFTLCTWNEQMQSDPETSSEIKQSLVEELHPILNVITQESQTARQTIEAGLNVKSMHEACIGSLSRTVERSLGQDGKIAFDKEVGGWVAQAGRMVLESLHNEGRAKTLASLAGEVAAWLMGLTAQFFQRPNSTSSQRRFTDATTAVFQSFCSSTENLTGLSSGLPKAPSDPSKMDYSPPGSSENLNPTQARRISSINSSSMAIGGGGSRGSRTSPRKPSIFTTGKVQSSHSGILKRSVSGSTKSSNLSNMESLSKHQSSSATSNSNTTNNKSGGVRWRDVESDGEERLESFDRTNSTNGTGSIMDDSMLSADQSSILLDLPSQSSERILSNSVIQGSSTADKALTEKMMEQQPIIEVKSNESNGVSGVARSNRMKAGYLSRTRTSRSVINQLDSLGEEIEEEEEEVDGDVTLKPVEGVNQSNARIHLPSTFSMNRLSSANTNANHNGSAKEGNSSSNHRSLRNKSSLNNLTSSFNNLSSSTAEFPSKDRRRESLIGPIRKPKPLRRQSLNVYKRQSTIGLESLKNRTNESSSSIDNQFSNPTSTSSTSSSTMKNPFPRRASRVPIINSTTATTSLLSNSISGDSSGNGSIGNLSRSRSPRKLGGIRKPSIGIDKTIMNSINTSVNTNNPNRLISRRSITNLRNNSNNNNTNQNGSNNSSDQIKLNENLSNQNNSNLMTRTRRISLLPTPVHHNNSFNNHQPSSLLGNLSSNSSSNNNNNEINNNNNSLINLNNKKDHLPHVWR